jgi:hypothetical protein
MLSIATALVCVVSALDGIQKHFQQGRLQLYSVSLPGFQLESAPESWSPVGQGFGQRSKFQSRTVGLSWAAEVEQQGSSRRIKDCIILKKVGEQWRFRKLHVLHRYRACLCYLGSQRLPKTLPMAPPPTLFCESSWSPVEKCSGVLVSGRKVLWRTNILPFMKFQVLVIAGKL